MDRRSFLNATSLYAFAALTIPPRPWEIPKRSASSVNAGPAEIERIREMTAQFARADDLFFGGDHALPPTAAYLTSAVLPLLHGSTGRHRPELFTVAAQLTYLAGWMSSDAGRAGQAQRYYISSARLADEANDGPARATALRALALQAVELGHHQRAVELAEAACSALPRGANPRSGHGRAACSPKPTPPPETAGRRKPASAAPRQTLNAPAPQQAGPADTGCQPGAPDRLDPDLPRTPRPGRPPPTGSAQRPLPRTAPFPSPHLRPTCYSPADQRFARCRSANRDQHRARRPARDVSANHATTRRRTRRPTRRLRRPRHRSGADAHHEQQAVTDQNSKALLWAATRSGNSAKLSSWNRHRSSSGRSARCEPTGHA